MPNISPPRLAASSLIAIALGFVAPTFGQETVSKPVLPTKAASATALSCSISSNKTTYKMGEVPAVQVRIKNEGYKAVVLVGSLDGSEDRMRYPYCYFEIRDAKGQLIKPSYARCGNTNPLRLKDFVQVPSHATFNPYMTKDSYGFFSSYLLSSTLAPKVFSKPGQYTVRFFYSADNAALEQWLGDGRLGQDRKQDEQLTALFGQVPKVSIQSNLIRVSFVE